MICTVNGKTIRLNPIEVKAAKKMLDKYLLKVKDLSKEKKLPTFFFTFLIVAQVITQEALNEIDPDNLAIIMNTLNRDK